MDKLTIFNSALSLIGAGRYEPASGPQQPIDLHYPQVLREASCRYNWSFTRRVRAIDPLEDGTYPLPPDCLSVLYFRQKDGNRRPSWIVTEGRRIHTDITGTANLVYTTDIIHSAQELPDSQPEFCQGVICLLASRIAREITSSTQEADRLANESEKHFMRAITHDAQAEASNKIRPLPSILARDILTQ